MRTRTTTVLTALAALGLLAGPVRGEAPPARGEAPPALTGLWKLVSYEVEARADGKMQPVMGEHPTGYAYFTPEPRVFFLLTGEGRKAAETDAERAALMKTLVSYTGKVTLSGDQWTTRIDAAWDPKWVGSDQTRTFTVEGSRLRVLTPWRVMPNWADQGETRSIVTFERAQE